MSTDELGGVRGVVDGHGPWPLDCVTPRAGARVEQANRFRDIAARIIDLYVPAHFKNDHLEPPSLASFDQTIEQSSLPGLYHDATEEATLDHFVILW